MTSTSTVATTLTNLFHGVLSFVTSERRLASLFFDESAITMHSHVIVLFLVYLSIHVYLVLGDTRDSASDDYSKKMSPQWTTQSRSRDLPRHSSVLSQDTTNESSDGDDDSASETLPSSSSSSSSRVDLELNLEQQCPQSTIAERRRFLVACNHSLPRASDRLNHYLQWHHQYHDIQSTCNLYIRPTKDRDYDVWVESCLIAMTVCQEKVPNIVLPRVIRSYPRETSSHVILPPQGDHNHHRHHHRTTTTTTATKTYGDQQHYLTDRDGHRIFHIIPAMMDDNLAQQSTYTLAVALYLDRQVDRHSMETITVCLDVRAGRGWPNKHAVKLVPFMKNSLKLILPLFPERLHKCVVYPLPMSFFFLWRMISQCMDAATVAKICVLTGQCTIDAPPPTDKLKAHLGERLPLLLEQSRVSKFKA
jgi:hypothetical protein